MPRGRSRERMSRGTPRPRSQQNVHQDWAEQSATRVSGLWRVVSVVLTYRPRPSSVTRDGGLEARRDGPQWRVSFHGTFMGYAESEEQVEAMLGDAYDELVPE